MSRVRVPDGVPFFVGKCNIGLRDKNKFGRINALVVFRVKLFWLVGQEVKTPASHAGNAGSSPARVTKDFRWRFDKRGKLSGYLVVC